MANFDTLQDNFNDNSINGDVWTEWTTGSGAVTESSGQLNFTTHTAGSYQGISTDATYALTGSYVKVKLIDEGNTALTSYEAYPIYMYLDANNAVYYGIFGGYIRAYKKVSGSSSVLASTTYSDTTHKYLRIRESGGTVYWDYSAKGITWTNFASETVANLFAVSALTFEPQNGAGAEASATAMVLDDLNLPVSLIKEFIGEPIESVKKIQGVVIESIKSCVSVANIS